MDLTSLKKWISPPWTRVLGVDVGGESLKYLILRRQGGKYFIERFGRIVNTFQGEAVFSYLPDILPKIGLFGLSRKDAKKIKTVVGVTPPNMAMKRESYPSNLSLKELRQMVTFELEKDMNVEVVKGGIVVDFISLGPSTEKEGQVDYFLVGMYEDQADVVAGAFTALGIIPAKITPQAVALRNLASLLPTKARTGVIGLLDIGHTKSMLVILKDGQIGYHRDILVGGEDFTKAITGTIFHEGRAIQFSTQEAERFKKLYGYPIGYSDGVTYNGAPLSEVGAMMRPVMERLSGEVYRSIGFYIEKHLGEKLRILYLLGGGSQLKHLTEFIAERIEVPVEDFPISKYVSLSRIKKQNKLFVEKYHELTGSLALALESEGPINLLPAPFQKIYQMALVKRLFNSVVLIAIGLITILTLTENRRKAVLTEEVTRLTRHATEIRTRGQHYNALRDSIAQEVNRIEAIDRMVKTEDSVVRILKLVSQTLPEGLSLTRMALTETQTKEDKTTSKTQKTDQTKEATAGPTRKKSLTISGISTRELPDIRMRAAEFALTLEKSGLFETVSISKDMMYPDSLGRMILDFEITADLLSE